MNISNRSSRREEALTIIGRALLPRRLLALLFIFNFAFLIFNCPALDLSAPPSIVEQFSGLTLGWNPATNSDGTLIHGGIATGQYFLSWDAGTNAQLTIAGLPGGFTWYFVAQAYHVDYVSTNHVRHTDPLGTSGEIAQTVPCPPGVPQLLVTGGVWSCSCSSSSSSSILQTSFDLVTWTNLGPAGYSTVAVYTGPVTNRQFFRVRQL